MGRKYTQSEEDYDMLDGENVAVTRQQQPQSAISATTLFFVAEVLQWDFILPSSRNSSPEMIPSPHHI
jgi:hypothetical protein